MAVAEGYSEGSVETGGQLPRVSLRVLGEFCLRIDCQGINLPPAAERLIALLAVRDRGLPRAAVAGILWPDSSEARAQGSLRSMLFRLAGRARPVIEVHPRTVRLSESMQVDFREVRGTAYRIIDRRVTLPPADLGSELIARLSEDLLPGWYDDWIVGEADAWHQVRLHALEALARRLAEQDRHAEAAAAAAAAVAAEPLRESARETMIGIQLAQGNTWEAALEYERYRRLLDRRLGVVPNPRIQSLVRDLPRADTVTLP